MPGLIVRNPQGVVILDMTMQISQSMGSVDTGGAAGSMAIPAPPPGKQAYYVIVPLVDMQREKGKRPSVSIVNNALYWSYSFNPEPTWGYFAANCRIYYGCY
jgi:hypothetical protein